MLSRFLAAQVLRYLASTQAFAMVVLHGGWVLLSIAVWSHASGGAGDLAAVGRGLLRAYAWLGGVDENGHGDGARMLAVWGKVSVLVWLLSQAWRSVRGARRPWPLWRIALVSGLVALAGYLPAMLKGSPGQAGAVVPLAVLFAVLSAGAAAWAVGASRLAERLIDAMRSRATVGSVAQRAQGG